MFDLGRTLLAVVERSPDALAIVDRERRLSYAAWYREIGRVGRGPQRARRRHPRTGSRHGHEASAGSPHAVCPAEPGDRRQSARGLATDQRLQSGGPHARYRRARAPRCPGSRRRSSTSSTRTSFSAKFRPALLVKGLDAFAEIVGAAQLAVALAFELDCERQAGILDIVYQLLRAALRQWRKAAQLFGQPIARRFKFVIGDAVGRNAPLIGLPTRNAPRAHHNVLGPRDADHLLQARGAARTRDLAETLLRKGIKAGFRDQAEIAGQRQFEADAEAITAAGSNDRLTAARRRGDVPGEARDMLGGRGIEKAADL